jgi:alanine racemase
MTTEQIQTFTDKSYLQTAVPETHRPTFARVSVAALEHNFKAVQALAKPAKLMAVVKADGYGHGLMPCARLFSALGTDYFGVGFLEEGIELRRGGIKEPILVLGGIVGQQIHHFLDFDLEMTASSVFKARAIHEAAARTGKRARVHLKIDTGIGRIGQNFRTAGLLFEVVAKLSEIEIVGIYSHFATAEERDESFAQEQTKRFNDCLDLAASVGIKPPLMHIANSAGLVNFPEARLTMVRPGLALYGQHAAPHLTEKLALEPAMSLRSEIVYIKKVRKGDGVSYGLTWHALRDSWVATVPIGYGDGYPRALSNKAPVLIGGKRYPLVGAVCMDQIMVDLGDDYYPVGEEVILWGKQGDAEIPLWELCKLADMIPYELPILLTGRVPRVYK